MVPVRGCLLHVEGRAELVHTVDSNRDQAIEEPWLTQFAEPYMFRTNHSPLLRPIPGKSRRRNAESQRAFKAALMFASLHTVSC